jgi:hypothetical protein
VGTPPASRFAGTASFGRPGAKALVIVAPAGFSLLFLSGVVADSTTWWEKLLLGLAAVGLTLVLARVASLAVVAEPGQLVIRNMRNKDRIPWSQIEAITEPGPIPISVYRQNALARQHMTLQVILHEGAVISATLYDNRMFGHRYGQSARARKRAISALNRLLAERS